MPPSARSSIIAKIQKLRAMTTEAGASENEASMAAAAIARLMAEHNISQTEASIRSEAASCHRTHFHVMADAPLEWREYTVGAIRKLFTIQTWRETVQEDLLDLGTPQKLIKFSFFGLPADVAAAVALSEIIHLAITAEVFKELQTLKARRLKAPERKDWLRSFRIGMAVRLSERIKALIPAPQPSTGTGLMVLKSQLVTAEFAKLGINIGPGRMVPVEVHPQGYAQGQASANRVDLGGAKVGHSPLAYGQGQG